MAVEEALEGSRTRRRMDLNLYLSLPPLPRPPVWLDTTMISPTLMRNSIGAAPEAPRTVEPEESLAPAAAAYSPSNALSTPEEHPMLDPIVYSWLAGNSTDGEEETDAPEPRPVDGANVSRSQLLVAATGLEGDDLPVVRFVHPSRVAAGGMEMVNTSILRRSGQGAAAIEAGTPELLVGATGLEGDDLPVVRFVRPSRVAAGGMEMVNTSILRRSGEGAAAIEAGTPELRFQRVIQISQQHSIVRPASANRSQGAAITDADRLAWAIQRTHNSLEAARRQKLDDDKVRGNGVAKKDGPCDCNSSFECNICLDPAKEPVVTPCGHLFCWPCLYQWLHAHSPHSECPVCKGEVLEVNVTPIYGRGGEERDSTNRDLPPRPRANRRESLRQQLQMADPRGFATVVRQLIQNQGVVRGFPNPTGIEMNVVPAGRQRARARRQQRQDNNASPSMHVVAQNMGNVDNASPSMHVVAQNMGNVASESSNQIQLPHSNGDNAAQMVLAASQQSSSVEQLSTSSTTAVIVGEPGSSRRSRPSESPTIRRTRRRPQ